VLYIGFFSASSSVVPNLGVRNLVFFFIFFSFNKFLKIEVVEELFEINYVTKKVKWLGYVHHREGYLGHY
jgi:hypothetical protein